MDRDKGFRDFQLRSALRGALRSALRTKVPSNKTFSTFQKGGLAAQNLKPPEPLPTPNKT